MSARPRLRFVIRLLELGAGVTFVLTTQEPGSPRYLPGMLGGVLSGIAWLAWITAGDDRRRALVALLAFSAAAGVCGAAHTTGLGTQWSGMLFVWVAEAATAFTFGLPIAALAFAPALAGFVITNLAFGSGAGPIYLLLAIGLFGVVLGAAPRQLIERDREASLLSTAERRLAIADQESQLISERNRLGRDLHDVLAHTLGAVSIQLTALDSRLAVGDPPEALRARVRDLHTLVGSGLQEARDAVRALRDDRLSLESQIARLCALHGSSLSVAGRARALGASEALALYRVVQEALTNAAKHAPQAAMAVTLTYEERAAIVVVDNGPSAARSPLVETGGGHGLEGMRARVELAGGRSDAGPHAGGWRVTAILPLGPAAAGTREEPRRPRGRDE